MDNLHFMLRPEALGWAAALLTLLTFVSGDMRRLRLLALAANAAFIAYGSTAQLLPVMVLHLALVPVNLWRLNEAFQRGREGRAAQPVQPGPRRPAGWKPARRQFRSARPAGTPRRATGRVDAAAGATAANGAGGTSDACSGHQGRAACTPVHRNPGDAIAAVPQAALA